MYRRDLAAPRLEFSPPPSLTVTAGDVVRLQCGADTTVNTPPSAAWTIAGRRPLVGVQCYFRYNGVTMTGADLGPGNCSVTSTGEDQETGLATWRLDTELAWVAAEADTRAAVQCVLGLEDDLGNRVLVYSDIYTGLTVLPRPGPGTRRGLRDWEVALLVVGLLLLFIILAILLCFCCGWLCFAATRKSDHADSSSDKKAPASVSSAASSVRKDKVRPIVQYVDIDPGPPPARPPPPQLHPGDLGAEDSVRVWREEGGGSLASSLSSLVTTSSSGDEDAADQRLASMLARLGDKFSEVARIYAEDGSSEDSDSTKVKMATRFLQIYFLIFVKLRQGSGKDGQGMQG